MCCVGGVSYVKAGLSAFDLRLVESKNAPCRRYSYDGIVEHGQDFHHSNATQPFQDGQITEVSTVVYFSSTSSTEACTRISCRPDFLPGCRWARGQPNLCLFLTLANQRNVCFESTSLIRRLVKDRLKYCLPGKIFPACSQAFSISLRNLGAPRAVVLLFIHHPQGSIALRSGELPGPSCDPAIDLTALSPKRSLTLTSWSHRAALLSRATSIPRMHAGGL